MGSSRFPGKPLKPILGMPMIGHVLKRTSMCSSLEDVYVATCDKEIFDYIESIGGKAVMTSKNHERCTDRTAEAVNKIEKMLKKSFDIVLMIQGDEPMVTPLMIETALEKLKHDEEVNVVNLISPIKKIGEFKDPNEVKVVTDLRGNALYFSREPIPSLKKFKDQKIWFKQVCIIPFRKSYLFKFNELEETPLEEIESVDMMRILENGDKVRCVEIDRSTYSVDTPEDLEKVEKLMKKDSFLNKY